MSHRWTVVTSTAAGLLLAMTAAAQPAPSDGIFAQQPLQGDCSLLLSVPPEVPATAVRIALDSEDAAVTFTVTHFQPFVATLLDPLATGSKVFVRVGDKSAEATVLERPAGAPMPTCAPPPPEQVSEHLDERATFEAAGYTGMVFDNFAPSESLGYANTPPGNIQGRFSAGVTAQLRLWGRPDRTRQLWLSTQTLHGVRTSDVDCSKTDVPVCSTAAPQPDKFLFILEHASTMEAHFEARFEFASLQIKTDTPLKVFASTHWGFLAMAGAPRVFNSDAYLGVGLTTPKGSFKGSFAEVAWGRSQQFQSDPSANRLKIYGTLVCDLAPDLIGRARNMLTHTAAASRLFVAIVVDRNPGGTAPESVQTYLGIAFDLRRLVGAF